jgi:peptide/nickel transport system substrate-binding protein
MADVDAGSADATLPVGSGPFQLVAFVPGDRTVVERNPNYWQSDENGNQLPYLDRITFRPIEDTQVREEALKSGDLTLMHLSDGSIIERLSGDSSLNQFEQNQFSETNYALLNYNAEVMQSKEVRCALLQAVDPEDLLDVVAFGAGTVSTGPFTPGQEGYLDDNGRLPYDPEAAAAAVEAWEAENGPLVINITSTPTPANKRTADYLLAAWGDVGIDVNINEIEQSSLIGTALQGRPEDFELFFWRNHAGLFVDQQYYWWHGDTATEAGTFSLNFGRMNDPVINELLDLARSESDPAVRRGYAEDINRRFASECLMLPTSQTQWSVFTYPSVQNFGRSPIPDHDGFARDGAGFPGQIYFHALYVAD